jgi:hypothetical protein
MKTFTLLFICYLITFSVSAQDFVRKTGMASIAKTAPALDGVKEDAIYKGKTYDIATWVTDGTPVDGASAQFWMAYDDENLYVFIEAIVPEKAPGQDEIGIMVSIDSEDYNFGWEGEPLNENGVVFSKILFGGDDDRYSVMPDEEATIRQFNYYYAESTEGYDIEVIIPWENLTTDAAVIEEFKNNQRFFFDIGFKLAAVETQYFAWSNNDNSTWEETLSAGVVNLRKNVEVAHTSLAPALDASKDTDVYSGDGNDIKSWLGTASPIEGISGKFWFSYDDDNLYVYTEAYVPSKTVGGDEIGILVSIDEEDYKFGWEGEPLNENGTVFSKILFGGEHETYSVLPDETATVRQFDYIYSESSDGYNIEVIVPWDNLTTDAAIVAAFKERKTFFFDIGFKLAADDNQYFAWSNNDNDTWQRTLSAGVVTLGEKQTSNVKTQISSFSVYPNPVSHALKFSLNEEAKFAEVFNATGKKVLSVKLDGQMHIDVNSLNNGIYLLNIETASGKKLISRFIKN